MRLHRRVLPVDAVLATRRHRMADAVTIDVQVLPTAEFETFYTAHRVAIAKALAMTLRDHELADEATDEAMARAYARWRAVREMQSPAGWVYRVGLNWARSVLRRRLRPRRQLHEIPAAAPEVKDQRLHAALMGLEVDRRAVVVCRYFLGMTEHEIASGLGIRPGTVKSRLHRALKELEGRLATDGKEDW